jgi:arsenate reductase
VAQVCGGMFGAIAANVMYGLPAVNLASHVRGGGQLGFSEVVATFGLIMVVFGITRSRRATAAPFAVGAYITAAYFFTSSTSFANPAVTVARMLSDTFAGISPASVPLFVVAQLCGGLAGYAVVRLLWPRVAEAAADVVVPHEESA